MGSAFLVLFVFFFFVMELVGMGVVLVMVMVNIVKFACGLAIGRSPLFFSTDSFLVDLAV